MAKILMYATIVVLIAAPIELASIFVSKVLLAQNLLVAPTDTQGYQEYLMDRDPDLGWPSLSAYGVGELDASGSRVSPANPDPHSSPCVSLYGDSFTWGAEVGPDEAYGDVLARRMGCRVANYGVGGYGTDQAVLRFVRKSEDDAPIVVLGHFSENVIRNVNQLRDLTSGTRFGFKPRFVFGEDGALELVPLPTISLEDYGNLYDRPQELLPFEYFLPNTSTGPGVRGFPYTLSVIRGALHYRVKARVFGNASFEPFYHSDHPSNALFVSTEIIRLFHRTAVNRGKIAIIVVIPDQKDLERVTNESYPSYAPLLRELDNDGIYVIDSSEMMVEGLNGRDVCTIYTGCGGGHHFNSEGYQLLADAVLDAIRRATEL